MDGETKKQRRVRRKFTDEFKAGAVRLVLAEGKPIAQVARDLDLTESSLHNWVRQAKIDSGKGPAGALTTAEKEELSQLRRENRELRMEREILKKAAVSSAGERSALMVGALDGANGTSWPISKGKAGTLGKVATRAVAQ
jgi:transposase